MSISLRRQNSLAIRLYLTRLFFVLPLLLLAGAFVQAQAAGITLVQHIGKDAGTTTTSTLAFASANTAGNFVAVAIRGGLSSSQVFTVSDSNGNTYKKAAQIGYTASLVTSAIYYAENIKAGANTITVSMTVSGPFRFDILEYSGVATSNSLDATAVATGSTTAPNSGNLTTTVSGDLLLATVGTTNSATFTAGTGYTIRDFVPAEPSTKHVSEDQIQAAAGLASAGVSLAVSDSWGAVLAAFKPAGGVAGSPTSITATAGTPQNASVNTAFAIQLQATVRDPFNNPVSGATVTFTVPGSGASGSFAGGVTTATTNASGVATAAVFTANTTAGSYVVTASVSGVSTPANFSLTNLAGAAASITATVGTPQSATINTAFATQLQATVKDSFNNPVSGTTVTFTAPTSGASGTFAGGVNTATTNASGVATAPVFTANSTTGGPYTVTASASGVGTTANYSLTNLAAPPASITATGGTPQSATVNTAFTAALQATVKDASNNPVSGVTVTFTAPASGASGTFAGGVNTATTNALGVATSAVFTANSIAGGPYNVTASVAGVSTPANFSLTNLAGPPANVAATAGTPQSAVVNTAFATQLQATVTDSLNNPVSGATVTFTAPASGASGTFAGGVNTATTNSQGVATAPVFTANATVGGPYAVTASVSGVTGTVNYSLTNLSSAPVSIALVQHAGLDAGSTTTGSLAFTTNNTAGNFIAVAIRGGFSNAQVFTVTDTNANTYKQAAQVGYAASAVTQAIYYAENVKGGANTITVTMSVAGPLRFDILEYSGVATSSSLDGTAVGTSTSSSPATGNMNTTIGGDLLLATVGTTNSATFTAGTGYTIRDLVPAPPNTKHIAEDQIQSAAGTVSAGTTLGASDSWGAVLAAFKPAAGGGGAGTPASITATAGTPQSATINTAFAVQLQATVKDASNNPVSGATVTFAAPGSGASGTFAGGVTTAITNASGVAAAAVFTANSAAGSYPVTAIVSGVASPANFSLTNLAGAAASVTAPAGTPQSTTVNTAFATQFQATVKDAGNNPVSGVTVTFTAPGSGASGAFAGGVNTATTNASGVATAAVFTANGTTGSYNVTASVAGVASPANFSLTNLGNPPASVTAAAGTPQSATINTAFTVQLQATVKDSSNNPVSGVTVTFAAPGSGASGAFAGGVNTATTNASGVATAAVFTANSTAGSYTVTASVSGVASPANFTLTNLAGAAASIAATAGTPQSATIGTAYATPFQASVNDAGGNPVSGVTVTFTAPGSGASGAFAGGVNTATTNASGVATAAVFTANNTAGAYTLTASVAGVASPANFSLTNLAGAAASITATAGTPQSTSANTAFTTQLQATVADSFNNPVSGVTVTFTAPASGASGTFAGGVSTATTNAAGVATAPVFTANSVAGGPYTVTASVSGVASPANFSLTNTASVAANIVLVQHIGKDAGTTTTSTLAFTSPNTAGNFIAVAIRGGLSNAQVFSVSDSNANTYKQAALVGFSGSSVTQAIYYAENIKAGANTITVTMSVSGPLRFAIMEYSGVATSNSLDATATGTNTSTAPATGNMTTTANGDLLLATISTADSDTFTAAAGYTVRDVVPAPPNAKMITEDQIQSAAGTSSASATLSVSSAWGAVLASFKPANGAGPTPTITSLSQTSGAVGVGVTITGSNFGATQGTSTVTFNGTAATVSNWSATSIITSVPAGATTGPVVVTVGGIPSNGITFTVVPAPSISGINPTSGPLGTSVTVSGANFGASQGSSSVTFNGLAGTPTSWSAASIVVPVPNGATSGNIVVTVLGTASNGVAFTVTTAGPSISGLSLTQGPVGAGFTINGANFGASQGTSTATLNGAPLTVTSWIANMINVTVPSGATTGNVVVTVGGTASNGVLFTVTPPPAITAINPTSGPIGTNVVITGTNFGPTVGTIQSFVTFNGTQTRASNWSDTSITAPVPSGATTGNVLVSVGGVSSNGVVFTVTPPPSITSLSPNFGPVGTSVTIAGANFGASQGTSTVTFNGTTATPTSWSASSIVVPVPAGATTGNVVVTEAGVPSNGVNFTVTTTSANIALVQHRNIDGATTTSAALAFATNTTAGNWIAVAVRGGLSSSQVFTVSDSNGNTYRQAFQLGFSTTSVTFALYYAENINGGADTITVTQSVLGPLRFAILEYSGVATSNSLDSVPAVTQGNSSFPNSGNLTTGASGDLLLGTIVTTNGETFTAGGSYTIEESSPAAPNTKLVVEDMLQTTAGTASAGVSLSGADNWGAGLAAFRSINGTSLPISVSVGPGSASVPSGYGTQSFTATVSNDFQNKGVTWSLSGAGCSGATCGTLTQITTTSATYNAPANVPSPAAVTITATSISDTTKSGSATITVTQGVLNVSVTPRHASATLSATQTVQFTANVTNDPQNLGVTWQVDGNNGGTAASGTISTTGLYTPGSQPGAHTVTAVSNANATISATALMAVTDLAGVYTHHNDTARTGQNLKEYGLTPATVTPSTFGQLFSCPVDGFVYAEPLWVANLNVGGVTRNVVFIATQHDSIYAFDADSPSCVQLWKVSFLGPNVTTLTPADLQNNTDITPEIGVTSTPVIDPASNSIYVMPKTKETAGTVNGQACSTASPCFVHRLHALNLATGAEKFNGPVVISATNFNSFAHLQRPALLLNNNTIYLGFGSHGDHCTYQGWVMGYDATTLAQKFVTALTNPSPNQGCMRGGVWMSGAGPAADPSGNVYVSTGNGNYDGVTNLGDTAVKLSPTGSILDWFTPFNQSTFNANDIDLASAGITILPGSVGSAAHPNLAIATGKVAILYLLDIGTPAPGGTKMGKFNSSSNNDVQEVVPVPPPNTTLLDGGNYGNIAYWNGNIYTTGQNFPLSQFSIANGVISTPQTATSSNMFPPRGGVPSVSANGTAGGIVWIVDYTGWQNNTPAVLDAYDATNVGSLLYSSPASGAGAAGPAVKWSVPTVANAKVYVGGQFVFTVYGLLP